MSNLAPQQNSKTTESWTISAPHRIEYEVQMTHDLLEPDNRTLARHCKGQVLAVIDQNVDKLYGSRIREYFKAHGILADTIGVNGDEESKDLSSALSITDSMSQVGLLRRSDTVVVFGGGVALDLVGFAASLYRRGVPYVRIPTTLIGLVDAGVGVKTGVNRGQHKNRLGTYFAPTASLIDPTFLSSVPTRHIRNGLAEILKIGFVRDATLIDTLESVADALSDQNFWTGEAGTHYEILSRAISGMLTELEPNLHESVLERAVDFGHTFSPSLELIADPPLLHGEAVAIDMALCISLSYIKGHLREVDALRSLSLIRRLNLPITNPSFTPVMLSKALTDTVKHRDGLQRVPLLTNLGRTAFANDITDEDIQKSFNHTYSVLSNEQSEQRRSHGIHASI